MSDVPATSMMLLAMDAWEEEESVVAAIASGLLVAMRTAGAIALVGFGLAVCRDFTRRWRGVLGVVLSSGAMLFAQSIVNRIAFGRWWGNPYVQTNTELLGASLLLENFALYGAGLLLLPPFPLLWILLRRSLDRWALAAVPVVLFFTHRG
jgi:hypothetical protein